MDEQIQDVPQDAQEALPQGEMSPPIDEPMQANPFDTSAESSQLEALQNELAQAESTLESDFANFASSNTTPELEELFFSDREGFYKKIQEMQNSYYKEHILSKGEAIQKLQGDIAQKQGFSEISNAQAQFLEQHPDADINALMEFYSQDIPPKVRDQIDNLTPLEFFNTLYELYMQTMQPNQSQQGGGLPQRIDGIAAQTTGVEAMNDNLPTQRF